jgi:cell division protein FtsZ
MDGASIAAIEPKVERGLSRAEPLRIPEPAPRAVQAEAPVMMQTPAQAFEQDLVERAAAALTPSQQETFETPIYSDQAELDIEPLAARHQTYESDAGGYSPKFTAQTPSPAVNYAQRAPEVEQNEYYEQPDPRVTDDRRGQKGGWLSLFGGRPRQDPVIATRAADPIPQFRNQNASQAAVRPMEEVEPQAGDDLEIPSFLRRLAN